MAQHEAEILLLISLRQNFDCHSSKELHSCCVLRSFAIIQKAKQWCHIAEWPCVNRWGVTCTMLVLSPTLTRILSPGDFLDKIPAIMAGSMQYFWPMVCIVGWYFRRYGMSISASLSEARTPKPNTKGRMQLGVTYAATGAQGKRERTVQGSG